MEAILTFYTYMLVLFCFGSCAYVGINFGMPRTFLFGAGATIITIIVGLISMCF